MWNNWMTEINLPCFIKMYLYFNWAVATPIYCLSVSSCGGFRLAPFFSISKDAGFLSSFLLNQEAIPLILTKCLWTLALDLAFSIGIFRKASSFKTIIVPCSHKKAQRTFWCAEFSSHVKKNINHCLHWDERDGLNFFRLTQRYNWKSTGIMSLTERQSVLEGTPSEWKRESGILACSQDMQACWKSPGVKIKKW